MRSQTIVFIHGAWVTPLCWERFIPLFEAMGHRCLAPAWPGHERPVEALRRQPDSRLSALGLAELTSHYARLIEPIAEPPILIGHGFGGLITQLLVDRGFGAAGVSISAPPPQGILPTAHAMQAGMSVLSAERGWARTHHMSMADFEDFFASAIPTCLQRDAYARYIVPAPGRIFFQAALPLLHGVTEIDFYKNDRAPLLLVAGDEDKTVPVRMSRANYVAFLGRSCARIDFHPVIGRGHLSMLEPGFMEVADHITAWLDQLPRLRRCSGVYRPAFANRRALRLSPSQLNLLENANRPRLEFVG